jgi:hypothetical protein
VEFGYTMKDHTDYLWITDEKVRLEIIKRKEKENGIIIRLGTNLPAIWRRYK